MEKPEVREKILTTALCQFLFPFSLRKGCQNSLREDLKKNGFDYFHLDKEEQEGKYYGESYSVSHRHLERYYLPFTTNLLFPHSEEKQGFQRYSRPMEMKGTVHLAKQELGFTLHSVDIIQCPFDLGFINVRIELTKEKLPYSLALEFVRQFRQLENMLQKEEYPVVHYQNNEYREVESFLFTEVVPIIKPYLDEANLGEAYFETLPFFVDERMHVHAFFGFAEEEDLDQIDAYRAGQLNGLNSDGSPLISANNMQYINDYCHKHIYIRWAPHTYFVTDDDAFVCLTNEQGNRMMMLANQMYGEYYYGLLLNLFHKIVLLKLAAKYSTVHMERDNEDIEELTRDITKFSSQHFFVETVSQTQGREIFALLRETLGNNELYEDVKETLASLFQYQDKFSSKRNSYLLMILTIYTVIGGIYGMNQVIEDLKGDVDWSKVLQYSVFEWIALFVTISGIVLAVIMGGIAVARWMKEQGRKRRGT